MKKILFNMPSQYSGKPSGVAWVGFALLSELVKNGNYSYILRSPWSKEELPLDLKNANLKVIKIKRPKRLLTGSLLQCLTVPALCRREHVDLVLNVDAYGAPMGGKARVMIAHDLYFKTLSPFITFRERFTTELLWRMMLAGNKIVVAVSRATKDSLINSYPSMSDKTIVIHSAATLDAEKSTNALNSGLGIFILAVGNNTYNKNYEFLAESFKTLSIKFPDLKLVHVGSDNERRFENWLGSDLSANRFLRFENLKSEQLVELYQNAVCLCVVSHEEGFCLPILEAQKYGCAVVTSNNSAMPEVAGEGALSFVPNDLEDLCRKVESVICDRALRAELVSKGTINQGFFTWKAAAERYESVFKKLLDSEAKECLNI